MARGASPSLLQKPRPGWGESGVGSEPAQFQGPGGPAGRRAPSRTGIVVPHSGALHRRRGRLSSREVGGGGNLDGVLGAALLHLPRAEVSQPRVSLDGGGVVTLPLLEEPLPGTLRSVIVCVCVCVCVWCARALARWGLEDPRVM